MLVNNMRRRRSTEGKKELHTKVFLLKCTHNARTILYLYIYVYAFIYRYIYITYTYPTEG